MTNQSVFIIADSRGRSLKKQLDLVFNDIEFNLYWKSGLKLSEAFPYTAPFILNVRPKIIYVLNGICDLTRIRSHDPWMAALVTRNLDSLVSGYMYNLDQTHAQFFNLHHQLGYKPMVLFPTQTGLDFAKYNGYPDDLPSPEQPTLDKAIQLINKNVIAIHRSTSVYPPILASAVHMRCRGKYRMAREKLYDGCHPTPDLCLTWAKRLHHNAVLNLDRFDSYTLINQIYND